MGPGEPHRPIGLFPPQGEPGGTWSLARLPDRWDEGQRAGLSEQGRWDGDVVRARWEKAGWTTDAAVTSGG